MRAGRGRAFDTRRRIAEAAALMQLRAMRVSEVQDIKPTVQVHEKAQSL
jgi:hypothetical protein